MQLFKWKNLQKKVQDVASPLAPKELARKAQDLLLQMTDGSEEAAMLKKPAFLIPNPVYDINPSTQQNLEYQSQKRKKTGR